MLEEKITVHSARVQCIDGMRRTKKLVKLVTAHSVHSKEILQVLEDSVHSKEILQVLEEVVHSRRSLCV